MSTQLTENQPFQLKNIYTRSLLENYAGLVKTIWQPFPTEQFLENVFDTHWPGLELKQRTRHISANLKNHLPENLPDAIEILAKTTDHFVETQGEKMVYDYTFIPDFIENFGAAHPEISLPALERMTRWTSAEFAVRPFLLKFPEKMFAQMLVWSRHESPMVRRLASEGFRPRLPWGMGVPVLKTDPQPILQVLEILKNDPAETVRRSVANNLNDISKDHPDLMLEIAHRWQKISPETDWVVRHACRGLLKKGHPVALLLFGFDQKSVAVAVENFQCSEKVKIGERLFFSFLIKNLTDAATKIRVEFAIDYLTSSGKISHKVFKIKEFELPGGGSAFFEKNHRFQDFTTRKHFAGGHKIVVLVNGMELAGCDFEVF